MLLLLLYFKVLAFLCFESNRLVYPDFRVLLGFFLSTVNILHWFITYLSMLFKFRCDRITSTSTAFVTDYFFIIKAAAFFKRRHIRKVRSLNTIILELGFARNDAGIILNSIEFMLRSGIFLLIICWINEGFRFFFHFILPHFVIIFYLASHSWLNVVISNLATLKFTWKHKVILLCLCMTIDSRASYVVNKFRILLIQLLKRRRVLINATVTVWIINSITLGRLSLVKLPYVLLVVWRLLIILLLCA